MNEISSEVFSVSEKISRSSSINTVPEETLHRVFVNKYKLNYKFEDSTDIKNRCFSRFFLPTNNLPDKIDMRSVWGEIYDQGEMGSCTSNSIAGQIRYILYKHNGPSIHPSRLFIYYNGRLLSNLPLDEDTGLSIKDACTSVKKYGVCDETLLPYDINKFSCKPSHECYEAGVKNNQFSYFRIPQELNQIKQCLAKKYMISFGAKIFESFMSLNTAKSGIVIVPNKLECEIGSHAMCIVGYNEKTKFFAVANSWSDKWGCNGFCFIPFEYILDPNLCRDFWSIRYQPEF
jgi:C1A family cysteine protease